MSKFSNTKPRAPGAIATSPVQTSQVPTATYEGGGAWSRTAASDLFVLAATNMVGEETFYESADARDKRYVELIREVTASDPTFIAGDGTDQHVGLAAYLRSHLLMRSAPIVMACEYVKAGGANGRSVVNRVCQRPDEPAEVLGYWHSRYGRRVPQAVKRGVADAAIRLYTERAALRYDAQRRDMRMGDVIELTHPEPRDPRQSALFKFLLDQRHHGDGANRVSPVTLGRGIVIHPVPALPVLAYSAQLETVEPGDRRDLLRTDSTLLTKAGWSWERLSGWLPGGMDAEAWRFAIPNMGVMALLRNLRNFDQAGIGDETTDSVIARITSPDEVAKARLWPFHSWLAYREAPSDNWKRALGKVLDLSTQNVPRLDGTLVVIDCSGSMGLGLSGKSKLARWEVGAVLGAAIGTGTSNSNVVIFGSINKDVTPKPGASALSLVQRIFEAQSRDEVGSNTYGHTAVRAHWNPLKHKRVIILTDDQMRDSNFSDISHVPLVYTVNLAGYAPSALESGGNGRHTLAGWSDATFTLVSAIEAGRTSGWPF